MTIQVSALRSLEGGGPVTADLAYPNIPGLVLTIEFLGDEENQKFWGTEDGADARDVPDEEFRDFHLDRIKGWNAKEGEADAPLDLDVLRVLWRKDGAFKTWLVRRCRHIGSFLTRKDAPAALAVGDGGDGGAA